MASGSNSVGCIGLQGPHGQRQHDVIELEELDSVWGQPPPPRVRPQEPAGPCPREEHVGAGGRASFNIQKIPSRRQVRASCCMWRWTPRRGQSTVPTSWVRRQTGRRPRLPQTGAACKPAACDSGAPDLGDSSSRTLLTRRAVVPETVRGRGWLSIYYRPQGMPSLCV